MLMFAQAAGASLITDYAIFANTAVKIGSNVNTNPVPIGPIGSNGGVTIVANAYFTQLSGGGSLSVGSNAKGSGGVTFNGNTQFGLNTAITGDVNSGGNFKTGDNTSLTGNVAAGGSATFGSNQALHGNIDAGGNGAFGSIVNISGNLTLGGTLSHGSLWTVGGATHTNGTQTPAAPASFMTLTVPGASSYTAGGANVIGASNQTTALSAGSYGALNLGLNNVLELTNPGDYYFNSWDSLSNFKLKLDFGAGQYHIFVAGDVNIGDNMSVYNLSGNTLLNPTNAADAALAQNVLFETDGNFTALSNINWFGTLFAPDGNIAFGSNINIAGALYSGGKVTIVDNLKMRFVPAKDTSFTGNPGGGGGSVPEPATLALFSLGLTGLGFARRRRAN